MGSPTTPPPPVELRMFERSAAEFADREGRYAPVATRTSDRATRSPSSACAMTGLAARARSITAGRSSSESMRTARPRTVTGAGAEGEGAAGTCWARAPWMAQSSATTVTRGRPRVPFIIVVRSRRTCTVSFSAYADVRSCADRVVDHDLLPEAGAVLPEGVVHWMHLVCVLARLVVEGDDECVRVRSVDDLPVRVRGRADEPQLHDVDRGEGSDAVDELRLVGRAEVVTQPEVHGVREHGWGGRVGGIGFPRGGRDHHKVSRRQSPWDTTSSVRSDPTGSDLKGSDLKGQT